MAQIFVIADDDGIRFRVNRCNENRPSHREAKPFALADSIKGKTLMRANMIAIDINDFAGADFCRGLGRALTQIAAIIIIVNKTNFLTLFFLGGFQPEAARNLAHFRFG